MKRAALLGSTGPLSPAGDVQSGSSPANAGAGVSSLCPCGCGTELKTYNQVKALCCLDAWKRVPCELKNAFLVPFDDQEREEAAARIIAIVKNGRQP